MPHRGFGQHGRGDARWSLWVGWSLLATVACKSPTVHEPPTPPPSSTPRQLPADVESFFSRLVECHHWAGEEPYDEERAKEIQAAAERLACARIEEDERALRLKYQAHREVIERLDVEKTRLSAPPE